MHLAGKYPGGVVHGLESKIRTGKITGSLAMDLGVWCRQLVGPGTTHEEIATAARRLVEQMQATVLSAEKADLEEARLAIKQALEKGTSMAFRKIKKEGMQQWVEAGGVVKSYVLHDQLEGQQQVWAKLWQHTGEKGRAWTYDSAMAEEVQPLSIDEFRSAARTFKASTSAVGGWHPRQLGQLSDELTGLLVRLVWVSEVSGVWPEQEAEVLVKMLPKAAGGHRPIMLFRSLFRVVGKARARQVKAWFSELTRAFPETNMAPRRWVSDATYRCQVRRYLGLELGEDGGGADGCECQWDLSKAFDRVGWIRLKYLAGIWKYPMGPLRLSLTSYTWHRMLVMDGLAGPKLYPRHSVAAGSLFAPYELCFMMMPVIMKARQATIGVELSIHMDDIMVSAQCEKAEAVRRITEAADVIQGSVEELGFVLERSKGFCLASSESLGKALQSALGEGGGARVGEVKRLGLDHWWGNKKGRRTGPVLTIRLLSGRQGRQGSSG